jgi:2-methylcitrate dehydratase PrpD
MSAVSHPSGDNPVIALADLVARTRFDDLSEAAVRATRTFLLDTLGCGVAGSTAPKVDAVVDATSRWGEGGPATVWGDHRKLPASQACIANGYRIHALEWDCVHEPAVVHPMATLLPALLAHAERRSAAGQPVAGRQLILSMALGVEIAAMIGAASTSVMRFFRPATCGGFGVVAGLGSMQQLDAATMMNAFGIQYGQTSGTMQAHVEGSMLLGLQVGFNGRAGLNSIDLAMAGLTGPRDILTGPYGYYKLFETSHDIPAWWAKLGKPWQITRLSHKPFPSGRLTHAAVDALQQAQAELGFRAEDLVSAEIAVPPLAYRLVGRPDIPDPAPNYARLCIPYVGAVTLIDGSCEPESFAAHRLADPAIHRVASRIHVRQDDNPDVNALWPQTFLLQLSDGRSWARVIETPIGHPENPLSTERHLTKFRRCWALSRMPAEQGERVIAMVDSLDSVSDVAELARLLGRVES